MFSYRTSSVLPSARPVVPEPQSVLIEQKADPQLAWAAPADAARNKPAAQARKK
jgi:hypothetical protein